MKYAYTLYKEIQALLEGENDFSIETRISDIFSDEFGELSWNTVLNNLELIYGFDIPDLLADQTELTIEEFGEKLAELPSIPKPFYPEFYELNAQMMEDFLLLVKIENGFEDRTQEEIDEINERLNLISQRVREITEFPLN